MHIAESEEEELITEVSEEDVARELMFNNFEIPEHIPDDFNRITFHWGIEGISMENKWDPLDTGKIVWD